MVGWGGAEWGFVRRCGVCCGVSGVRGVLSGNSGNTVNNFLRYT